MKDCHHQETISAVFDDQMTPDKFKLAADSVGGRTVPVLQDSMDEPIKEPLS